MAGLKLIDAEHPWHGVDSQNWHKVPQCTATTEFYRCMGDRDHSEPYHVTYGRQDYFWEED